MLCVQLTVRLEPRLGNTAFSEVQLVTVRSEFPG